MSTEAKKRLGRRGLVAAAALLSGVLSFVVPGSIAYAAGMIGFILLPLLLLGVEKATTVDGGVRYGTSRSSQQWTEATIRVMGALAFAAFGFFSRTLDGMLFAVFGVLIGNGCALLSLLLLFTSAFGPRSTTDGVTLEATTLTLESGSDQKVLLYSDVQKVEYGASRIVLTTSSERHILFVSGKAARAALIAQAIVDAKAKAASAAENVDEPMKELHRASGMSVREWFGRIDALAAASRSAGAYRGGAIDEEHLRAVLFDEQADLESRTAAARVLASTENPAVRTRIAASVNDITDERVRARVELAMRKDAEQAAAEMEALETEELRKIAGV